MKKIGRERIVCFIGSRGTGKSTLITDLMYHHRDIPMATVICGTKEGRKDFGKIIPETFIYENYTPELIAKIINRQEAAVENEIENPYAALIMDDCLHDVKVWMKDEKIRHIFFNGRHDKLFYIFAMQFSLGISPELRNQIDYVFILREPKISNRRRLYDHFAGMFPSFEIFCRILDEFTENYECLVIDNTSKSNKIEDQIFYYKAKLHKPFTVGCQSYWNYHWERYNKDYKNDQLQKEREIQRLKDQYGEKFQTVLIKKQ